MVTSETLSDNLRLAFGFGFKTTTDTTVMYSGAQDDGTEWYAKMASYGIIIAITDQSGKSVWFELENSEDSRSGIEASLLCKYAENGLRKLVSLGRALRKTSNMTINGRIVKHIWISQD